ncbi:MAG: SAM-dependent chlorinase/fluorinase, partial [Candidatus Thermoplasmatota archaeon]|nr:SAM-dependent chlorinase/fluorinase [Candidatus Thermoplasmatota archaeon]
MISLTTDFGSSAYVGAMRGAMLTIHPDARLVDITHDVPAHDVQAGAFALFQAAPFFPDGTVHLAVVDPGVGTERKGIAIEAGGHLLVGPDNGLLLPAARRLGLGKVFELTEEKHFLKEVSATFHGRDIFG